MEKIHYNNIFEQICFYKYCKKYCDDDLLLSQIVNPLSQHRAQLGSAGDPHNKQYPAAR